MTVKNNLAIYLMTLLALVTLVSSSTVAESPTSTVVSPDAQATALLGEDGLNWKVAFAYVSAWLQITGPDGWSDEVTFGPNAPLHWTPSASSKLVDGLYRYDLHFAPLLSAAAHEALDAAPERPEREVVVAELIAAGEMPETMPVIAGRFIVQNGALQTEAAFSGSNDGQTDTAAAPSSDRRLADQVIADDLIVHGAGAGHICVGFACEEGESFGAEVLKLKKDWTQILFEDSSTDADFPSNDWRLKANDQGKYGDDYFALVDETYGTVPLRVDANARTNALRVASNGKVGIGEGTPAEMLHLFSSNAPAIRLEQHDPGGWGNYTWDLRAHESWFAVRDAVVNTQPFRVYPGEANYALVLNQGRVGIGIESPGYDLHLYDTSDYPELVVDHDGDVRAVVAVAETQALVGSMSEHPASLVAGYGIAETAGAALTLDVSGTLTVTAGLNPTLQLDANGNMVLSGALTEASDVNRKEHFQAVDGEQVLAVLAELPISTWNYIGDDPATRHMGPMAQDFYAAFGLGADETHMAPLDVNGVTLAGMQALQRENASLRTDVDRLEQVNADLQARLGQLEALVQASLAD